MIGRAWLREFGNDFHGSLELYDDVLRLIREACGWPFQLSSHAYAACGGGGEAMAANGRCLVQGRREVEQVAQDMAEAGCGDEDIDPGQGAADEEPASDDDGEAEPEDDASTWHIAAQRVWLELEHLVRRKGRLAVASIVRMVGYMR
jgi:hypothetical protein